jgi:urea transporter
LSLYFPWSALMPPLILAAGGLSAMITQQWLKRVRFSQYLPAYTTPFVVLSWLLLCFATPSTTAHLIEVSPLNMLAAPLKGVGQVMFLGHPLAGAMIAAGLLIADRRAFCWALLASVAGMGWSMLHHDFYSALLGLGGYNAVLAALALTSQRQQPWLPLVGIGLALLLTPMFAAIGLPTLTTPFILACWLVRSAVQMFAKTTVTHTPCTLEENQPRLR